jgi:hypothetical protein
MRRAWLLAIALVLAALSAAHAETALNVQLKDGKVVGERTLRVRQGEEMRLTVSSDRKIALHLHGYDIERTAEPEAPAVFAFAAKATGRFSVQSIESAAKGSTGHGHGAALFYLEVLPR